MLHSGAVDEVVQLRQAVRALAGELGRRLPLAELAFVHAPAGCALTLVSAPVDAGVVEVAGAFEWRLMPETWLQVEGLLEPFAAPSVHDGFQYLNPARGPGVIYSTERGW